MLELSECRRTYQIYDFDVFNFAWISIVFVINFAKQLVLNVILALLMLPKAQIANPSFQTVSRKRGSKHRLCLSSVQSFFHTSPRFEVRKMNFDENPLARMSRHGFRVASYS